MTPTTAIYVTALVLLVALAIATALIIRSIRGGRADGKGEGMELILEQLNQLSRTMDQKMGETTKQVNDTMYKQLTDSQRLIKDINEQVSRQLTDVTKGQTEMKERSNQIFTIAEQLQDLQRTLKSQKERGNFGEQSLEMILGNILPTDVYQMQYRFADNTAVDAVIHARDGIIPVDAKFSLESYNQLVNTDDEKEKQELQKQFKEDLKKRIDETAKYIKPKEGTLPFAFMFIPAEGIYYDLLINRIGGTDVNARNLIDYAMNDKKVVIVSPTTFYAYLQSVLYGFKAFQVEKNTEQIQKNVSELSRHLNKYDDFFKKVGKSISTTVNHYNAADKEFQKVEKDVTKITGETGGIDTMQIERPQERDDE